MSNANVVKEMVRLFVRWADGTTEPKFIDVTGPTSNAERTLAWSVKIIEGDGGKIEGAQLGTLQGGEFRPEHRRRVPMVVDGYRRVATHLRA